MKKYNKRRRIIAVFFLLIFFPTLVPSNLFASNNGPVAPEAASFEPVDATDMVNLMTGDMSYVLPLLNVPSPEGGFPLALSYHAGIAMDQEASWVGLGWSLNPGAINRSVKGVPDDWDKTRISDLLYDSGGTLDFYNFSIGGTLPNGLTLGMSAAWGANRAWGGIIGYGGRDYGLAFEFGSEDMRLKAGVGPLSYGMGQNSGSSLGINLNSGAFRSSFEYSFDSKSLNVSSKLGAIGVSYNSNGQSNISLFGGSLNNLNTTATSGDYYTKTTTKGFNFDAGFFWLGYQHTQVKYSLFKLNVNNISGTLNLFDSKNEVNYLQNNNDYMDVKNYTVTDKNIGDYSAPASYLRVLFPNYDNYSVSAQGINGSFSPKIFDEVLLYGKGSENVITNTTSTNDPDATDMSYLTNPSGVDANYKLNNKLFFYFDNVNSSFLRTQKGNFITLDNTIDLNYIDEVTGGNIQEKFVNNIVTDNDDTFSSLYSKDGFLKKNGNRKRDGNFIEAFTNSDIVNGNTNGTFFDVSGFNRQFYSDIAEKGIGAYRVTTLDGKTYHFSLPVYNYEEVYKNYTNSDNENDKFLENIKTKPYATHWLLTAITGPDFVDKNNNNEVDEEDYGYWVKFEYGKWSDGYGWRSPKIGGKVYGDKNLYFWGRKEVYYLDKIQTRTHTALFVKSVRNDDKSTSIQYKKGEYQSGPMPSNITENFEDKVAKPIEKGYYYSEYPTNTYQNLNFDYDYDYKHKTYKYVDLPENLSLKLDRIILLKNIDAVNVSKNLSIGVNRKKGYSYFDYGFYAAYSPVRKNPYDVKVVDINSDQNVLDIYDISNLNINQGFDIQTKAVKVINFNYDYSLGSSLPNASQGRLALKTIWFKMKNNSNVIPPYRFNYIKSNIPYDFNNTDEWGFVKDSPDAWSLNEIITPIGSKIKIEYESDSFSREAAFHTDNEIDFSKSFDVSTYNSTYKPLKYTLQNNILTIDVGSSGYFSNNLNNLFNLNDDIELKLFFLKLNQYGHKVSSNELKNSYSIVGIDDVNKKISLKANERTDLDLENKFFEGPSCYLSSYGGQWDATIYTPSVSGLSEYAYSFRLISNYNKYIAEYGRNGMLGGGIRVSKVISSDFNNNNTNEIEYNYFNPFTHIISGVTSFKPSEDALRYIQSVEEIPSPNVNYEYVTTKFKNNTETLSSTVYKFRVMDDIFLSDPSIGNYDYRFGDLFKIKFYKGNINKRGGGLDSYICSKKATIYNRFSNLGQLLSVKTFNSKNQLVESTINKYKEFDDESEENGIIQESYKYITRFRDWTYIVNHYGGNSYWKLNSNHFFTSISKVTFPSVLESTTKIKGGNINTTYFDKYDFLTGQVVESRMVSSDGQSYKTRILPAYVKYSPTGGYGMGSKVDDITNKNMLSQIAAEYSYIWDKTDNKWKETGVGITTWSNIWNYIDASGETSTPSTAKEKIWRKHKTYVWNGVKNNEGIFDNYNSTNDDGFDWTIGVGSQPSNSKWKQVSETTLYNHFSSPLEVKDINNNYAATKMDSKDSKVMAVSNARFGEVFYTGGEENYLGIGMSGGFPNSSYSHTGNVCIETSSSWIFNVSMKNLEHREGRYKLNVWVKANSASKALLKVNGTTVDFVDDYIVAGNWRLKTAYFNLPSSACSITLNSSDTSTRVYYDDLMIRPIASSITGYVYNEWGELSYIIGNNGLASKFEYDAAGRLIKTYSEFIDADNYGYSGFKLMKTNTYHNRFL